MTESFKHDFVFRPPARNDYERLGEEDRASVDQVVESICLNPSVDNVTKFDLPMFPVILRLYDDGQWSVIYNVIRPFVVQIFAVARADPDNPLQLRR